ncbi:MAG: hypothetical protein GF334_03985 [Candidatus Altiarchaeales archaeon]|nr:hypothetical protein [Candidatus Altiarchaeales archaeon]
MEGINVRVYHQGGPHEKIQFRFCAECYEDWVHDFREHQWENDLRDREDIPDDADIIDSKA